MPKAQILIVEDDRSLADVLDYNLRQDGYQTTVALDGQDGLQQAKLKPPDLVVLDLMLPMIDGLEICRRLRADPVTRNVLVLMLTAKTRGDRRGGRLLGRHRRLRRQAVQREGAAWSGCGPCCAAATATTANGNVLVSQGVMIDRERHRVTVEDELLDLTPSEFGLLEALIRQPGRVFSRSELIDAALGGDSLVLGADDRRPHPLAPQEAGRRTRRWSKRSAASATASATRSGRWKKLARARSTLRSIVQDAGRALARHFAGDFSNDIWPPHGFGLDQAPFAETTVVS